MTLQQIDNIDAKVRAIKTKARSRYKALVIDAANDRDLDEVELLDVIRDAGKSLDDFRTAVSTLKRRMEAVAWLEQADQLQPKIDEATETHTAELRSIVDLQEKHKEELKRAFEKKSEAYGAMRRLESERDRLRSDAHDILRGTAVDVRSSVAGMKSEILELQNRINRRAVAPLPAQEGPQGKTHPADVDGLKGRYEAERKARWEATQRDEQRIKELESAITEAYQSQWDALAFDIV